MQATTLYLQKYGERDDIIVLKASALNRGMFHVTMHPGDLKHTRYSFLLTREGVRAYVSDMLKMLTLDSEPFEFIQVTHVSAPAVLIPVASLDEPTTRWFVEDNIVSNVCDLHVMRIRTE